jgi:hypothetical protein
VLASDERRVARALHACLHCFTANFLDASHAAAPEQIYGCKTDQSFEATSHVSGLISKALNDDLRAF